MRIKIAPLDDDMRALQARQQKINAVADLVNFLHSLEENGGFVDWFQYNKSWLDKFIIDWNKWP